MDCNAMADRIDLRKQNTAHLSRESIRHLSSVYNFNNRAILTDRPFYDEQSFARFETPLNVNGMDSINIQQPHTPGRKMVSTNAPAEYADRFYSRPTGRPHIVGFDGRVINTRSGRHDTRGFNGFFPSMKLRVTTPTQSNACSETDRTARSKRKKPASSSAESGKTNTHPHPFILELVPERPAASPTNTSVSSRGAAPRGASGRSTKTIKSRKTSSSIPTSRKSTGSLRASAFDSQPLVYPYIIEDPQQSVDDLTELPKPMMVTSKDNPWVYRYKVKRSMNELSKILASKPPSLAPSPLSINR